MDSLQRVSAICEPWPRVSSHEEVESGGEGCGEPRDMSYTSPLIAATTFEQAGIWVSLNSMCAGQRNCTLSPAAGFWEAAEKGLAGF